VAESAPNAMVMVNGDGQIEMVSAQAERVFGYSRDEPLDKPVDEHAHPTQFSFRFPIG